MGALLVYLSIPASQGDTSTILLIRVEHTVQRCDITVRISNDRIGELIQIVVGKNILNPTIVRLCAITRQSS